MRDITERKRAEERQELLLNELNHRVKNTLATVQSLARQSLRGAASPDLASQTLEARLMALSQTHNLLTQRHWQGAALGDVLAAELAPYMEGARPRVRLQGPPVNLPPQAALALGMTFHELATNAAKYGALSMPEGEVAITWEADRGESPRVRLCWVESGGPPVEEPTRRGFGSRLIERGVRNELGGVLRLEFRREGLRCEIELPLEAPQPS
jgi:two-component sensor histidine kinase